jgi:hypothetical protein
VALAFDGFSAEGNGLAVKLTVLAAELRRAVPRRMDPTVCTSSLTSSRGFPGTTWDYSR